MKNIIPMAKRMILIIVIVSAAALVVGLFLTDDKLGYTLGLLLGAAVSCAQILLLNRALNKSVTLEPTRAKVFATGQYYLRLMLFIAALLIAALVPVFNVVGAVVGVLAFVVAAYVSRIWTFKMEKDLPQPLDKPAE